MAPPNLFGLDRPALEGVLRDLGVPGFHAGQVFRWMYERGRLDPAEWTDLAQPLKVAGIEVEAKRYTLTFHYRGIDESNGFQAALILLLNRLTPAPQRAWSYAMNENVKKVAFTQMKDGTREEYLLLRELDIGPRLRGPRVTLGRF